MSEEARDVYTHIPSSEKLCNNHPSEAIANVQIQGLPVTDLKAAFLPAFIYHNESG